MAAAPSGKAAAHQGDAAPGRPAIVFTLYARSWCHLCDDMLAALHAFMAQEGLAYAVEVRDVDADPALLARFDELVPVLYGDPAGPEICHYFLDQAALRRHLDPSTDA